MVYLVLNNGTGMSYKTHIKPPPPRGGFMGEGGFNLVKKTPPQGAGVNPCVLGFLLIPPFFFMGYLLKFFSNIGGGRVFSKFIRS